MSPRAINRGSSMLDKKTTSFVVQFYMKLPEEIINKAIEGLSRPDQRNAKNKKKFNDKIVVALNSSSASKFTDGIYQYLSGSMLFSTDAEYEDIISSYNNENCIMNTVLILKKCYDGSFSKKIISDFIKSEQFMKTLEDNYNNDIEDTKNEDTTEKNSSDEIVEIPDTENEMAIEVPEVNKIPEVNKVPEEISVTPEETLLQIPEVTNEKPEPVQPRKKPKENGVSYYIGHIEKRETYYNFAPQYKVEDNGTHKKLIELHQVAETFPPNGTINLSYVKALNSQSQKVVDGLDLQYTFAIAFDEENLEKNINTITGEIHGDVNLKINLQKEFDKNRNSTKFFKKISELRIFRIVETEDVVTDNKLLNGTIEISNDFAKDELILLRRMDINSDTAGTVDISGPYKVYKKDGKTIIQPKISDERYLLNCHREDKLSFGMSERQEFGSDPVCIPFAVLSDGSTYKKDIISDEILIKNMFSETSKDFLNLLKKKPDEFIQLLSRSSFLSGSLPDEVKLSRLARIRGLFEDIQNYTDEQRHIAKTFLRSYTNDSEMKEVFSEMVISSPEYKELQKELEKQSKAVKSAKSEVQLAVEKIKASQIDEKNGKIEELEKQIEELKEKHSMLETYDKIAESVERLKSKRASLLEDNAILEHKNSEIKRKIKTTITEQANEVNIAFDPYVSNAMLESASEWNRKQENEIYSKIADYVMYEASECKNMERKELCTYLVGYVKKYRNYSTNDIFNMYICLTQGFLTIFSGLPGTGKTSVCNIIGNSLGLTGFSHDDINCNRFVPVSVEKGWSSKKDLIGYYNPLTKKYDKSNRRLYDSLMVLNEEKESSQFPYLVLLDEANLSPMEYYWADFMQLADRSENNNAYINIGLENDIYIPETLRFVATINNDQTTETLSPRLIDRAWIIKLPDSDINAEVPRPNEKILWKNLVETFSTHSDVPLTCIPLLERISKLFHSYGMTVSPRIKLSMINYISSARELMKGVGGITSEYVAVDYAVMQRLLPKINCRLSLYKKFFDELISICNENHLNMTRNSIEEMMKNAERNMGYCQYLS